MLTPLGFYLLFIVITFTIDLLMYWAYGTDSATIEAGWSRPADWRFPAYQHARPSHVRFAAPRFVEIGRRSRPLRPRLNFSNGRPTASAGWGQEWRVDSTSFASSRLMAKLAARNLPDPRFIPQAPPGYHSS
jgi:hypothetical protein